VMSDDKGFHLLVVDDNSPDGTSKQVELLQESYPGRLHLIKRAGKLGLGTAYVAGFHWSLECKYDMTIEMDCDFSHNPDDLCRLVNACENGADVAVGSRYIKGGGVKDWPRSRLLLSYFASLYVRLVLWLPVRDTTAGFKCYRNEVLAAIDLDNIPFMGYAFQIYMKYSSWKKGFKIVEIPIIFKDRQKGVSKMNKSIIREAVFGVLKMRFKSA